MSSMMGAVWGVLFLTLLAANAPFFSERLLLVGPRRMPKPLAWCAFELLLFGAVTLGLGVVLETRLGQRHAQGWEFYAAFGFLFVTFAFPGFVWRYLRKSRNGRTAD